MTSTTSLAIPRLGALAAALGAAAILSACVVEAPAPRYVQAPPPRPAPVYPQPAPDYVPDADPVVSVYVDPPIEQPEPIAVQWAPPPMLVEVPPPQPYPDYVWTGGYWAWEGRWFWSAGRWAPPPRPAYVWVQPYYEHRNDVVVFVPGFWCAPERHFVPPPPGISISVAIVAPGVRVGRPPMGPQGVFVPPPPGSRAGIIVPAPVGTPPAVVVSAPAVVNVGMRVRGNVDVNSHNTVNNVTNITNVTNVTIEAPAGATANGQAFQNSVPARAHLAAGLAPAGRPAAPMPVSQQAIPSYQSGRAPMPLPSAQPVRTERNDRFNVQNGAHGGVPAAGGTAQPAAAQGRPEFDQPPRTPATINGQGQQPAWQQGQPAQPGQQWQQHPGNGQPQGQPPAWQQGQQSQPGQQWQQHPGNGQPQAQGQQPAAPQGQQWQQRPGNAQPQPQPQGQQAQQGQQGQQAQQRPGNGQPQAQGQQPGQPAQQGAQRPGNGQPQQAQGKEGKQGGEKDERRKTEHEHPEDRKKDNGERDR